MGAVYQGKNIYTPLNKFNFMINLLDPKFKTPIKIIGIFCFIVAALIYGDYQYLHGKFDQCLDQNGFLLMDHGATTCLNAQELAVKGFTLDKPHKRLVATPSYGFNASLNWSIKS